MATCVGIRAKSQNSMAWNNIDAEIADTGEDEIEGRKLENSQCYPQKMHDLLTKTMVYRWRPSLGHLLQQYYQHSNIKDALKFLISTVTTVLQTLEQLGSSVIMDYKLKPAYINLDDWRNIMLGLNLEITEPDTNKDITLVGLSVTSETSTTALRGFHFVLLGLQDLSWENLQMILYLENQQMALQLIETILEVINGRCIPPIHQTTLSTLHERYSKSLASLGFIKGKNKQVSWQPPISDMPVIEPMIVVLLGFFKNIVKVSETSL